MFSWVGLFLSSHDLNPPDVPYCIISVRKLGVYYCIGLCSKGTQSQPQTEGTVLDIARALPCYLFKGQPPRVFPCRSPSLPGLEVKTVVP